MDVDLFAGVAVNDYAVATEWFERLLGEPPSFLPNDVEAVWRVTDHGYVYIRVQPEHAGHAIHTLFVEDLDDRLAGIAQRGLEPVEHEEYDTGVRKVTFRDPDGNLLSFAGGPG